LAPSLEVLIDPLTFGLSEAQELHHMGLAEPIEVIKQGDQGIAADDRAGSQPVEKPPHRCQQLLVVAQGVRLTE
jgi:hypothetical protein